MNIEKMIYKLDFRSNENVQQQQKERKEIIVPEIQR